MKILITGGSGYLGGRLSEYLSKQAGIEIYIGSRIIPQKNNRYLTNAVHTIWDSPEDLERICKGMDAVIHLAGMNANDCAADPVAALEFNAVVTARLVREAVKAKVKRFIYFSTTHVYRSPLTGTITEETVTESLHPYATSHKAAEDVVRSAGQRGEIEDVIIRLSNAFGAPVNKGANCWMLLVNDLCRQAVVTKQMKLLTSGLQHRNFITIADVCRATFHLLTAGLLNGNTIFNVGSDWSPTILEMATLIQETALAELGYLPVLSRCEPKANEISAALDLRIDKLYRSGFDPMGDITEEVSGLIRFCKENF